jgi:hypothetical protein
MLVFHAAKAGVAAVERSHHEGGGDHHEDHQEHEEHRENSDHD